jgi:hypothetical protein
VLVDEGSSDAIRNDAGSAQVSRDAQQHVARLDEGSPCLRSVWRGYERDIVEHHSVSTDILNAKKQIT